MSDDGARLVIVVKPDGALLLRGPVRVVTDDGRLLYEGTARALCRCGASRERPFCDGSHHVIGFRAD